MFKIVLLTLTSLLLSGITWAEQCKLKKKTSLNFFKIKSFSVNKNSVNLINKKKLNCIKI